MASSAVKKAFSKMQSHLPMFAFVAFALGVISKTIIAQTNIKKLLLLLAL
jgi:hypothetical protein